MVRFRQDSTPPPLSPFLTIFRWPVTMVTSIVHRVTGFGLIGGVLVLAWWLFAIQSGPQAYGLFYRLAITTVGQILIYAFVWCYAYHFLNGIRHLCWDFGMGFQLKKANLSGMVVIGLSFCVVAGIFALIYFGYGGYYDEL